MEEGAREVGLGHSLATKLPLTWEGVRAWAGGCGYGTELSLGGGGSGYDAIVDIHSSLGSMMRKKVG